MKYRAENDSRVHIVRDHEGQDSDNPASENTD